TAAIDRHDLAAGPLVLVNSVEGQGGDDGGSTDVFLFMRDQPGVFAASVIGLDQLRLSRPDAPIHTSPSGLRFNTYVVSDELGNPIASAARRDHSRSALAKILETPSRLPELARRRVPRRLQQFRWPTQAHVVNEPGIPYSMLHVIATDRPGLLARLGVL